MDRRLEGEPLIDVDSFNANYASYSTFWHTTLKLFSSSDERTDHDGDSTLFRSFLRVSAAHGTGGNTD